MRQNRPKTLQRCPVMNGDELEPNRGITIVPEPCEERLSKKEWIDYYEHRRAFLTWLYQFGKNPKKAEGYSPYTIYATGNRATHLDRWLWDHHGQYTMPPTSEDATLYMEEIALGDGSTVHKGKHLEMCNRYSKWLTDQHGQEPWEFKWKFSSSGGNNAPRDFLTVDERRAIRQAALHHDGSPGYGVDDLDALTETDMSWKFTSLVWTSLDAGLRPVEVGNARVSWVDTENALLRIPMKDSAKNENNWSVSITNRTATALAGWLEERANHPHYTDTDSLWLTRKQNRYGSNQLGRLLRRLCDKAEIDYSNRDMSWYTLRHSVGTYMTKERDLAAAKAQLRHRNPLTTMKYDQVPVEERRNALDQMG